MRTEQQVVGKKPVSHLDVCEVCSMFRAELSPNAEGETIWLFGRASARWDLFDLKEATQHAADVTGGTAILTHGKVQLAGRHERAPILEQLATLGIRGY